MSQDEDDFPNVRPVIMDYVNGRISSIVETLELVELYFETNRICLGEFSRQDNAIPSLPLPDMLLEDLDRSGYTDMVETLWCVGKACLITGRFVGETICEAFDKARLQEILVIEFRRFLNSKKKRDELPDLEEYCMHRLNLGVYAFMQPKDLPERMRKFQSMIEARWNSELAELKSLYREAKRNGDVAKIKSLCKVVPLASEKESNDGLRELRLIHDHILRTGAIDLKYISYIAPLIPLLQDECVHPTYTSYDKKKMFERVLNKRRLLGIDRIVKNSDWNKPQPITDGIRRMLIEIVDKIKSHSI